MASSPIANFWWIIRDKLAATEELELMVRIQLSAVI
jgi:hypothetical protein